MSAAADDFFKIIIKFLSSELLLYTYLSTSTPKKLLPIFLKNSVLTAFHIDATEGSIRLCSMY